MIRPVPAAFVLSLLTTPAFAGSDNHLSEGALLGQAAFKSCQACHVVTDAEGNTLAGNRARTGPDLYGVIGRTAGTADGYRFSDGLEAAGEAGLVWNEETMIAYLMDSNGFIQDYLDDPSARIKMRFKARPDKKNDLTAEQVAANFYAFLAEIGPEMDMDMNMDMNMNDGSDGEAESSN